MTAARRLVVLALVGCSAEEWRNADFQLDVISSRLSDEDRVRVCVEGVGTREVAYGAGRVAFPGLPTGGFLEVTVDGFEADDDEDAERIGRAGPAVFEEGERYLASSWRPCLRDEESCPACSAEGSLAEAGAEDWLLAVRFRKD